MSEELEQEKSPRGRKPKVVETGILPEGWSIYDVVKIEIVGYKNNEPKFQDVKIIKSVKISEEQAEELNQHKGNTLKEYRLKK